MSERTYRILFEHAPVALWDVDVDAVARAAAAMQGQAAPPGAASGTPGDTALGAAADTPGVAQAWASHLIAHPELVRTLAAAVVVREANRRALSLGAAANDVAALLAHVPVASASRLLAAMVAGQPAFAEETTWQAGPVERRVGITFERLDDAGGARGLVGVVDLPGPAATAISAATPAPAAEVAQLERALAGARDELARFVYAASHDLQAPLRMIVGYTDLLQRRYGDALDERAAKYVRQAGQGGRLMRAMLDGLLMLSRVFTRPLSPAAVNVGDVLADVMARLRGRIADSGARITHDELPTLTVDPAQLGQVLEQLLDNAIKFRGAATPAIHVGARRAHDAWILSITDNGIGMDPGRIGSIFAPFQRLHAPGTYPGTGLGLTIVAKIVERHGGQTWATSQPGQGATIHALFPDVVT
jgi:signal transduction histidine kinase